MEFVGMMKASMTYGFTTRNTTTSATALARRVANQEGWIEEAGARHAAVFQRFQCELVIPCAFAVHGNVSYGSAIQ